MRVVAVTLAANAPADAVQLTRAQLFAALQHKARDTKRFVRQISRCTVLEEHTWGLVREVQMEERAAPVRERVAYMPPAIVEFEMSTLEGAPLGRVTNLVSEDAAGALLLTIAFALGARDGVVDEGAAAEAEEGHVRGLLKETIGRTIGVAKEMVASGEIEVEDG